MLWILWDPFLLALPIFLKGIWFRGLIFPLGNKTQGQAMSDLPQGQIQGHSLGLLLQPESFPDAGHQDSPARGGCWGLCGHSDLCPCWGGLGESGRFARSLAFICLLTIPISGAFFFFCLCFYSLVFPCAFSLGNPERGFQAANYNVYIQMKCDKI